MLGSTPTASDIHLVEDSDVGVLEHCMVLPDHVISLGGGHDDGPVVGSEGEVCGTDEVSDVLDDDDVVLVQVHGGKGLLDEVCIKVALLSGVAVHCIQSGLLESLEVIVTGNVSGDDADLLSGGHELLSHFDDEGGLSGSDGSHEVDGFDIVFLEKVVVLVCQPAVGFEHVDLHSSLDDMHACGYA